jgi:hypothetical protein
VSGAGGPAGPEAAPPALALALAARFVLEIALLVGVAVVALRLFPEWWGWAIAVGAVIVVATLWGLLLSPRAAVPLPAPVRLVVEAVLFLGVGACLVAVGLALPAVIGVVAWIADRVALALLDG